MGFPLSQLSTISRIASAVLLATAMAASAAAQTLTDPRPGNKHTQPPASNSSGTKQFTACPEFGAGFVRMPGSDTCIKIGGFVEGSVVGRSH